MTLGHRFTSLIVDVVLLIALFFLLVGKMEGSGRPKTYEKNPGRVQKVVPRNRGQ